jgi:MFS family permease
VASLLMDSSSELIHSLLPVFLTTVLGASVITLGVVEGVAEATAAFAKVFSGALSDRFRSRKPLMVLGYSLAAFTKPLFPLATSVGWVFGARLVDRVGKGIRGAPRDALVADIVPAELRGAAYGLRQALDSAGALLGPVLALAFLAWYAGDLVATMWVAVVPAVLTVAVLLLFVREPAHPRAAAGAGAPSLLGGARRLPLRLWLVVSLGAVFTLARFSEAFLILRAQEAGLPLGLLPLVLVVMNACYAALAYPAGAAADRVDRHVLLTGGLGVLIAANLLLAAADSPGLALAGVALWGVHQALTQGLLAKLVADSAPAELRGTAFGVFHLASAGALLAASVLAGFLWSRLGPPATFLAGAIFAAISAAGVLAQRLRRASPPATGVA